MGTNVCILDDTVKPYDYQQYVAPIYSSTLRRLKATDIDQEVKERGYHLHVSSAIDDHMLFSNSFTQCTFLKLTSIFKQ